MWLQLSRQLLLFLVIGAAQVALDASVFVGLTALGLPIVAGNVFGRISGACLGYYLNGRYTFADQGRARLGGAVLRRFVVAWGLLTVLSTALLWWISAAASLQMAWLAKPAVEALMAAIGFVVWRQFVYR